MNKQSEILSRQKAHIKECYNAIGSSYDSLDHASTRYNEALETKKLTSILNTLNRCSSILDVGCGTGRWLEYLIEIGFKDVCGLDITENMLAAARQKFDLNCYPLLIKGDAEHLTDYFSAERFDVVLAPFCDHILSHKRFFTEVYKVLRANGSLIASFPDKEFSNLVRSHYFNVNENETRFRVNGDCYIVPSYLYSPSEIKELLSEVGFSSVKTRIVNAGENGDHEPTKYIQKASSLLGKPIEEVPVIMVVQATKQAK